MKTQTPNKRDLYKALAFAAMLIASAFPASIIGMRVLNFLLAP